MRRIAACSCSVDGVGDGDRQGRRTSRIYAREGLRRIEVAVREVVLGIMHSDDYERRGNIDIEAGRLWQKKARGVLQLAGSGARGLEGWRADSFTCEC